MAELSTLTIGPRKRPSAASAGQSEQAAHERARAPTPQVKTSAIEQIARRRAPPMRSFLNASNNLPEVRQFPTDAGQRRAPRFELMDPAASNSFLDRFLGLSRPPDLD